MSKKTYSRIEFIKFLKQNGFVEIRQGKHLIFGNGKMTVPIPSEKTQLNRMLTRRIIKEITKSTTQQKSENNNDK